MNTTKVDESRATPSAWVDVLDEHDGELSRVRLFWRRGKSRYRPLIRADIDPAELERAPMSEWDAYELAEGNLLWITEPNERAEERRRRLKTLAAHFWGLSVGWTESHGPVCDFQLRGYGDDNAILFEVGKRCHLGRKPAAAADEGETDDETLPVDERERDREFLRRREDRLIGDFDQVHRTYAELLGRLAKERNDAVSTTQDVSRLAPTLLSSTGEILKDAIAYQREHVTNLLDQASGRRELEILEFQERHRSFRQGQTLTFASEVLHAVVGSLGPLAVQLSEIWTSRASHAIPEFKIAQQAMAYLLLTLSETQLRSLFSVTESIRSFNQTLSEAARMADEREALEHLPGLDKLLRCKAWSDVATPEQQIAGRFIVGRAAVYRMEAFG
ncbi:hypothetical protein ACNOYE_34795 [Nannocystaceae bacterium ST9]